MIHAAQIAAGLLAVGHPAARAMPLFTDPLPTSYPALEPGLLHHPVENRDARGHLTVPLSEIVYGASPARLVSGRAQPTFNLPASALAPLEDPVGVPPEVRSRLQQGNAPAMTNAPVAHGPFPGVVDKRSPEVFSGLHLPHQGPGTLLPGPESTLEMELSSIMAEEAVTARAGVPGAVDKRSPGFLTGPVTANAPYGEPGRLAPGAQSTFEMELSSIMAEEAVTARAAPGGVDKRSVFSLDPHGLEGEPVRPAGQLSPAEVSAINAGFGTLAGRDVAERPAETTFSHPRFGPMIPPPVPVPSQLQSLFSVQTAAPEAGVEKIAYPPGDPLNTRLAGNEPEIPEVSPPVGGYFTVDAALKGRDGLHQATPAPAPSIYQPEPELPLPPVEETARVEKRVEGILPLSYSGFRTVAVPQRPEYPTHPGGAEPLDARAPVVTPTPVIGQRAPEGESLESQIDQFYATCTPAPGSDDVDHKGRVKMSGPCGVPNGAL